MSADKTHIIEVRRPGAAAPMYVVRLGHQGDITIRANRDKARRMSPAQAESAMPAIKRALQMTPAIAVVVRA